MPFGLFLLFKAVLKAYTSVEHKVVFITFLAVNAEVTKSHKLKMNIVIFFNRCFNFAVLKGYKAFRFDIFQKVLVTGVRLRVCK